METRLFNALDFGIVAATGNGSDNAIALQRAVNEVQAAGGGTIEIRPGTYEVSGTIYLDPPTGSSVRIHGGEDVTLVETGGAQAVMFEIGNEDEGARPGEVFIQNLHIQGAPAPVGGATESPAAS